MRGLFLVLFGRLKHVVEEEFLTTIVNEVTKVFTERLEEAFDQLAYKVMVRANLISSSCPTSKLLLPIKINF